MFSVGAWKSFSKIIEQSQTRTEINDQDNTTSEYIMSMDDTTAKAKVESDFKLLSELVNEIKHKTGSYPADESGMLSSAWKIFKPGEEEPNDPFDGKSYGYYLIEGGFVIWSTGPDGVEKTDDDILYNSKEIQ